MSGFSSQYTIFLESNLIFGGFIYFPFFFGGGGGGEVQRKLRENTKLKTYKNECEDKVRCFGTCRNSWKGRNDFLTGRRHWYTYLYTELTDLRLIASFSSRSASSRETPSKLAPSTFSSWSPAWIPPDEYFIRIGSIFHCCSLPFLSVLNCKILQRFPVIHSLSCTVVAILLFVSG